MAEVVTMPRLSDTMTEGKVAKWHKKLGDSVKEGDILAEIETDKAVQDFETEWNGTILHIGTPEGESAPVDSILAIIGQPGEDISSLLGSASANSSPEKEIAAQQVAEPAPVSTTTVIPAGVEVINMPRLSDTMTEGKVAKWNKIVGDTVKEGDIIAEIETDKAVQDFETEFNGNLLYQGVSEGDAAPVDSILAIIGPAGTDISSILSGGTKANSVQPTVAQATTEIKTPTANPVQSTESDRLAISPLAKKMAQDKGIDLSTIQGTGGKRKNCKKRY